MPSLSLNIPVISDDTLLSISDTSDIPALNANLLIGIPGFNSGVQIPNLTKGFSLNLTACHLNLSQSCTIRPVIPDGIYSIRMESTYQNVTYNVWYNHLKTSSFLKLYYEKLNLINLNELDKTFLSEMYEIKTLLDAAISQVEYTNDAAKGMSIYNYALTKLNLIT
jgi:hypothetical protein